MKTVVEVASKSPSSTEPGRKSIAFLGHRQAEAAREHGAEGVGLSGVGAAVGAAEGAGEVGGILVALEREGVIPVRVHRAGRVALVRDRGGQEAVVGAEGILPVGRALVRGAEAVHRLHRAHDVRPQAPRKGGVAHDTRVLGDAVDELSVRIVLGRRVGAGGADAAGHAPVGVLVGRVPFEKAADLVGDAEAEQGGAHERAVADPRALVRAAAGLEARPVGVDECVGKVGPHRLHELGVGHGELHAAHAGVPAGALGVEVGAAQEGAAGGQHRAAR